MYKTAAGPDGAWHAGKEYWLPPELAESFVKDGAASYADGPEKASLNPFETAAKKPAKSRG